MEKPAGVQIKNWLLILALLLLVVNTIAVVSLFLVYSYVNDIKTTYQPIVKSSSTINEKIMSAQIDLYKYLSEYQKELSMVFSKTKELQSEIKKIKILVKENNVDEIDIDLLNGTIESTKRFEKAIIQLLKIEKKETVDWEKVNDLKNYAMEMGSMTLSNAARVENEINLLITKKNIHVTLVTLIVVCTLFIFFVISIIVMIQLHYWWRHFEDLILEL